jgi:iron complex transport system permease protein
VASIIWDIRVPRSLGAWLSGALLGLAGALAQGVFRNPLADPYLLGSASGASLGVACVLAVSGLGGMLAGSGGPAHADVVTWTSVWTGDWPQRLGLTGGAFVGSALAVALTLLLARGVQHTLRLLLAGVVVGVVLGAMASLLLQLSPLALASMQGFLLGSTAYVGWPAVALMAATWLPALLLALALARALDALSLGESTAMSLGLPLAGMRLLLIGLMALATAVAVAQTGLIAFVGLAAPHLVRARALAAGGHRRLLLLASLVGGALLLAADLAARGLLAPQELPVGVLTAVIGGVYLLISLNRRGPAPA